MSNRSQGKPIISRKTGYVILFSVAFVLTICLLWFAFRAMAGANPWVSAIGIAAAAVYVVIVLARNKSLRSFRALPPNGSAKPNLLIVKK